MLVFAQLLGESYQIQSKEQLPERLRLPSPPPKVPSPYCSRAQRIPLR